MWKRIIAWILSFFQDSTGTGDVESSSPSGGTVVNTDSEKTKKALLVGINDCGIPGAELNGCVNDSEMWWGLLTKTYGFDPDNIRVLNDSRATKPEILKRLQWLIEGSKSGDELVFCYSGHGSQIRDRSGDELDDNKDECVSGSTLISTDVGLVRADRLYTYLSTGKKARAKVGHSFYPITAAQKVRKSGIRRITTRSGMLLETSLKHKVSTFSNGALVDKYADELTTDDVLLVSSGQWSGECEPDLFWYIIGLFIGDGYFSSGSSVRIGVRKDIEDWKKVGDIAQKVFDDAIVSEGTNCRGDFILRVHSLKLTAVLRGLGFVPGKKKTGLMRDIPIPMQEACWKGLLRGLFDAEGCSSKKQISFGSTDYLLIKLVLIGLRWFGIDSAVGFCRPRKGKSNTSWNIHIAGEDVHKFDNRIGFGFSTKRSVKRDSSVGRCSKMGQVYLPEIVDFVRKWNLGFIDFLKASGKSYDAKREPFFRREHIDAIVSYLRTVRDTAFSIQNKSEVPVSERHLVGASIEKMQSIVGTNQYTVHSRMERGDFSDLKNYTSKLCADVDNLLNRDWGILRTHEFMRIDQIETVEQECDFYDFTVAEVERFEADGILVHNCLIAYQHSWDDPLLDDDLFVIFKELPEDVFLTMLCDSCHSGTMTRGIIGNPTEWKPKFLPPPFDIAARSMGRDLKTKHIGTKDSAPDTQRHVLLSGCRDDQTSADAVIDGKWGGALTVNLIKVLKECADWDWVHIHEEVVKRISSAGFSQIPQLSGMLALRERVPFGGPK